MGKARELREWLGITLADLLVYLSAAAVAAMFAVSDGWLDGALAAAGALLAFAACPAGMRPHAELSRFTNAVKRWSYPACALLALAAIAVHYAWFAPAAAQSETEMQRLKSLDERCYKARAAKLKALQADKVRECVEAERRPRDECEKYWEGYGWGTATPHGRQPRFYDDIPECIESFNAWQNPRRQ